MIRGQIRLVSARKSIQSRLKHKRISRWMGIVLCSLRGDLFGPAKFRMWETTQLGDLDWDAQLGGEDIDILSSAVRSGSDVKRFDLNHDGVVNTEDRTYWVAYLRGTFLGDANLDGEFTSGDMVQVFAVGKYETEGEAGWAEGDWDGSGLFNSSDLVAAYVDGGYERGQRAAVATVPEPAGVVLIVVGIVLWLAGQRRCRLLA